MINFKKLGLDLADLHKGLKLFLTLLINLKSQLL